jgi:glycosyltransferase involved in cell wall biosynthesis
MSRQKGFDLLVQAYARVAPGHPDWRLRICGGGQERPAIEALIRALGIEDVVELPGPAADMAGEMARASIFVLSSRYEGLPLILLEAMSAGMGVVSFDCPTGPGDLVDDHRTGLLVPPRDVEALAVAIGEMMDDEDLRRRCGAAAIDTAAEYTMAAVGPRWEALLGELGASRGR